MIELINLSKTDSDYPPIDGLTLSIAEGEIFGLLGPVDSGQSTTLRILATLLKPSGGDALIQNRSVSREPEAVRRLIGYQPNFFGAYEDMRTSEYLEFFALAYGVAPHGRREHLDRLLALAGLEDQKDLYIAKLDREMRQRLAVIKTLVHDPPVLLLDEPADGLNLAARLRIRELIQAIHRTGKTILVCSNIMSDLLGLCQRLAILQCGRLLGVGSTEEMLRQYACERLIEAEIVGNPAQVCDRLNAIPAVSGAQAHGDALIFSLHCSVADPGAHDGKLAAPRPRCDGLARTRD